MVLKAQRKLVVIKVTVVSFFPAVYTETENFREYIRWHDIFIMW